jgi:hypothetical protein
MICKIVRLQDCVTVAQTGIPFSAAASDSPRTLVLHKCPTYLWTMLVHHLEAIGILRVVLASASILLHMAPIKILQPQSIGQGFHLAHLNMLGHSDLN